MDRIEDLNKRIKENGEDIYKYARICKICADLLSYDHFDDGRRRTLIKYINEIADKKHFDKVDELTKLAAKATGAEVGLNIETMIKKRFTEESKADDIYYDFFSSVMGVDDVRKILYDAIKSVVFLHERNSDYRDQIKELATKQREEEAKEAEFERNQREAERKRQLEEQQRSIRSYTYESRFNGEDEYEADVHHMRKEPKTKEEKTQRRAVVKIEKKDHKILLRTGYYLDQEQLNFIKQRFGLENVDTFSHGFISDKSIRAIVRLYEVENALKKKVKNISPETIGYALSDIYTLAVQEAKGEYLEENLASNMKRFCNNYGGLDFVGRYDNLYKLLNEYIASLPPENRDTFKRKIFATPMSHAVEDLYEDGLGTPQMFRYYVNKDLSKYIVYNGDKPIFLSTRHLDTLRHCTKYMDADDIASLVFKTKEKFTYSQDTRFVDWAEEVCAELIMDRMPGVNTEDADNSFIREKRIASIYVDYFHSSGGPGINISLAEEGYAKKLVAQQELISAKKKQYYGMSKFKKTFASMDFSRLVKLSRLTELSDKEESEVRRMF